jgi:hypothetical protein
VIIAEEQSRNLREKFESIGFTFAIKGAIGNSVERTNFLIQRKV